MVQKRDEQVGRVARLLYPIQRRDHHRTLFFRRCYHSLGHDAVIGVHVECMPSKSRLRCDGAVHDSQLTITTPPMNKVDFIMSRSGPALESIGVSHHEHG